MLETLLGFFGGVTLGLSQAWLVVLAIGATTYLGYHALTSPMRNRGETALCSVVLITTCFGALFTLAGFSEPRAYLFPSPMISALASIGFAYARTSSPRIATASYAVLIVVAVAVVGNLRGNNTPFKRNSTVPFAEIIDFVRANEHRKTAVLTMDASLAYSLSAFPEICVAEYQSYRNSWLGSQCLTGDRIDTVIIIRGDPLDENNPNWRDKVAESTRGKQAIAQAHFGHDDDARLKSRLTGRRLSSSLLDAATYR